MRCRRKGDRDGSGAQELRGEEHARELEMLP